MVKLFVAALLLQGIIFSVLASAEFNKVCCAESEINSLRSQVQKVVPFLVECPTCVSNLLNTFCNFSCSPDQSHFINVTSSVTHVITLSESAPFPSHPEVDISYNPQEELNFMPFLSRGLEMVAAMVFSLLVVDWMKRRKSAMAKLEKGV